MIINSSTLQAQDFLDPLPETQAQDSSKTKTTYKSIKTPYDSRFFYFHMLLRGRLQLGKVVSPLKLCVFSIPLTFGVGWWLWFDRASHEVLLHLGQSQRLNLLNHRKWMRMVPGLHIICVYRLARHILDMEIQEKDRRLSPFLAAFLSLQPSFAAAYIQHALNRHWTFHVDKEHEARLMEIEQRRKNLDS